MTTNTHFDPEPLYDKIEKLQAELIAKHGGK